MIKQVKQKQLVETVDRFQHLKHTMEKKRGDNDH
jgi:hypothetical protein